MLYPSKSHCFSNKVPLLDCRLSDLDELIDEEDYTLNNVLNVPTWEPRSKEDMVENAIEGSKGNS